MRGDVKDPPLNDLEAVRILRVVWMDILLLFKHEGSKGRVNLSNSCAALQKQMLGQAAQKTLC